MVEHAFYFTHDDVSNHYFTCMKCGYVMGFNKPGVGEPTADLSSGEPEFPFGGEVYTSPCPVTLPGEPT